MATGATPRRPLPTTAQYIEHKGRTKILVKGQISNYVPNPTFTVVGSPGAQEECFTV
jgi:hypothetical protein